MLVSKKGVYIMSHDNRLNLLTQFAERKAKNEKWEVEAWEELRELGIPNELLDESGLHILDIIQHNEDKHSPEIVRDILREHREDTKELNELNNVGYC